MTSKSLVYTVYLECIVFTVTMLFAASSVDAKAGSDLPTRDTNGTFSGSAKVAYNNHSLCYNNQNQQISCTKKKAIIVGCVIGALFVILGGLYIYATCSERRRKRKERQADEESRLSLGRGPKATGGKNGASKTSKKGNESGGAAGYMRPSKFDEGSLCGRSSVSDFSGYSRPTVFSKPYAPLETSDPDYKPSTRA